MCVDGNEGIQMKCGGVDCVFEFIAYQYKKQPLPPSSESDKNHNFEASDNSPDNDGNEHNSNNVEDVNAIDGPLANDGGYALAEVHPYGEEIVSDFIPESSETRETRRSSSSKLRTSSSKNRTLFPSDQKSTRAPGKGSDLMTASAGPNWESKRSSLEQHTLSLQAESVTGAPIGEHPIQSLDQAASPNGVNSEIRDLAPITKTGDISKNQPPPLKIVPSQSHSSEGLMDSGHFSVTSPFVEAQIVPCDSSDDPSNYQHSAALQAKPYSSGNGTKPNPSKSNLGGIGREWMLKQFSNEF